MVGIFNSILCAIEAPLFERSSAVGAINDVVFHRYRRLQIFLWTMNFVRISTDSAMMHLHHFMTLPMDESA